MDERQQDPAQGVAARATSPSDAERGTAREALLALEHAVATVQRDAQRDAQIGGNRQPPADASGFAPPGASYAAAGASAFAPPAPQAREGRTGRSIAPRRCLRSAGDTA